MQAVEKRASPKTPLRYNPCMNSKNRKLLQRYEEPREKAKENRIFLSRSQNK
jgi:hypothetical protein